MSVYASQTGETHADYREGDFFVTNQHIALHSLHSSKKERMHLIEYTDDCVCATATEKGQQTRYCSSNGILTLSLSMLQHNIIFNPPLSQKKLEHVKLCSLPESLS